MYGLSSLSAGSGGGGGAGIHTTNCGTGGLAGVDDVTYVVEDDVTELETVTLTQHPYWYHAFVSPGGNGTITVGGSGGEFANYTSIHSPFGNMPLEGTDNFIAGQKVDMTTYPVMSGRPGGDLGLSGAGDDASHSAYYTPTDGVNTSWTNNTDDMFKRRLGGSPGFIIDSALSPVTGSSTGVFKGHTGTIPGLIGDDGLTI